MRNRLLVCVTMSLLLGSAESRAEYIAINDLVAVGSGVYSNDDVTLTVSPAASSSLINDALLEPAGRGPFIDSTPTSTIDFLAINGDLTIDVVFDRPILDPAFNISGMDNSTLDFGADIELFSPISNFGSGTALIEDGDTLRIAGGGWDGSVIVKGSHDALTLSLQDETTFMGLGVSVVPVPEPSSAAVLGIFGLVFGLCWYRRWSR